MNVELDFDTDLDLEGERIENKSLKCSTLLQ